MSEHTSSTTDPERILQLKEELTLRWSALPIEHQATMVLKLVRELASTPMGDWVINAIALRVKNPIPTNWVSKDDLLRCRPDLREQIIQLSHDDLSNIADKVGDALQETYWQALDMILTAYLKRAE